MRLVKLLGRSGEKISEFDDNIFYWIICNYNSSLFGFSEITGELQLKFEDIKYEIIDEVTRNII